jgi:hypothetical protein
VNQIKRMTGRWISVLVTLTMIAVFGNLAPASASAAAGATVAPAAKPMDYLGCLNELIDGDVELTQLHALFCVWGALDPSIPRAVLICTSGLVFTGTPPDVATRACTAAITPDITRSIQSGIRRRAGASPNPASSELTSGARIPSSRGPRPVKTATACAVSFEGSNGYKKCGTSENYVILDSGSGYGTLQAFVVGTDGALWTAWGTVNGTLKHGWESMGGNLSSLNCSWMDSSDNAVVQGYGPDGTNKWCRYRTYATESWGAWFECNGWAIPANQGTSC